MKRFNATIHVPVPENAVRIVLFKDDLVQNVALITPEAAQRMQDRGHFDSFRQLGQGERAEPGWPVEGGQILEPLPVRQTPQRLARAAAEQFARELGTKAAPEVLAAALLAEHEAAEIER